MSVELNLLPSAKPLRDRARVHLHVFTAETIAEVSLLEGKQLKPGQSGLARLKLDAPCSLPGDRFIIRQFSPVITIGGGVVLDASEPARRKPDSERFKRRHCVRPRFRTSACSSAPIFRRYRPCARARLQSRR